MTLKIIRKTLTLTKAAALALEELRQPVMTNYQLGLIVYRLYLTKGYQGFELNITKQSPTSREFSLAIKNLLENGFLKSAKNFPEKKVFEIYGRQSAKPEEVACVVDPFCYISHLSAMAYHGLTNRLPRTMYISSPPPKEWKVFAIERMKRDCEENLDGYIKSGFPQLTRIRFRKIGNHNVECHYRSHHGAFRIVKDSVLRVSTIGRTFLDMLREPKLCGGIRHVLETYGSYAKSHLRLIINEIDAHGDPIDKVRAGYILEERCGLRDPDIDKWITYAQRGGSRKLDSSEEYSPLFSERWSISLNVIEEKSET
jgi:predicted transcriptional regulator of viral defense system